MTLQEMKEMASAQMAFYERVASMAMRLQRAEGEIIAQGECAKELSDDLEAAKGTIEGLKKRILELEGSSANYANIAKLSNQRGHALVKIAEIIELEGLRK